MSLRRRLTALTALLLLVCTSALGVVVFVSAWRIQLHTLDTSLAAAVADTRVRALTNNPRPLPADVFLPIALGDVPPGGTTVQVLRTAGTPAAPLPFPALTMADVSAALTGPQDVSGDTPYRVLARQGGGQRGIVIAAAPTAELRADLTRLAAGIAGSVVVISAIGAALAWVIVRRAVRPVEVMADAARRIGSGDVSVRVPTAPPRTELGELADALNTMIGSLTESLSQVEQSEERLRAFVSDASHEIRTPLTVIRGYVELLGQEAQSPLSERALARIDVEARRLERLVTQLLLLERSESWTSRDAVPLDSLVRDAFADLASFQPERSIDLDLEPVMMIGDADAWAQVVANIVQNLQRHTPADAPVHVRVSCDSTTVTLRVDDAGPGLTPSERIRLLDRFARGNGSGEGFGLGMAIIAAVAKAHHGSVALDASPMGGLALTITAALT